MTNEEQMAAIKDASERYAAYYGDVRRLLTAEFAADVRWQTASLFALNAGGLLSLANEVTLSTHHKYAGLGFWLGIVFAFALVSYSQMQTKIFVSAVSGLEEKYVLSAATGSLDEREITGLEEKKRGVSTALAPYLSTGSFLMFSIAIYFLSIK